MSGIEVQAVSKSFRHFGSDWRRILSWIGITGSGGEKQILKDISFSISAGEAVGIVGQNGAGKSTLLKILANTMQPSSGNVVRHGRIAALLELGMGFNPDLTGRANVLNTAGLMGFSRAQIDEVMADIEAFAEIGDYFDQPLRIYSSGMQVRLAFAVATAFRPEILIIDEALSVGDAYFQHKSFNRIREFREAGTTLLLVSHDRAAIVSLCDRAILIDQGIVRKDGPPEDVLDLYNAIIAEKEGHAIRQEVGEDGRLRTTSGTGQATIEAVRLFDAAGNETEILKTGEKTMLQVDAHIHQDIPELVVGYMIKDRLGQPIFGTNTYHLGQVLKDLKAKDALSFRFSFDANFGEGNYSVAVSLHQSDTHIGHNYQWQDLACTFSVANTSHPRFVGVAHIPPTLEIVR
ncbi:ABC transporter ATP-binding protein [Shinella zoogloeoides]|uniref:ABC transporter ATP-binding protein n=1 Tax=Shinella zoogloeoides TaxID=352475 RepID=UPI001F56FDA0|nr:ABC transporter ATP-binding protein [Shinella zoogloeoides]